MNGKEKAATRIDIMRYPSPIGVLGLAMRGAKLVHLEFENNDDRMTRILGRRLGRIDWHEGGVAPEGVTNWLDAYFAGRVMALPLDDIEMMGTDFQKTVWRALTGIAAGHPVSYAGLASQMGNARAVRAVARANALNPVSLIVPCHRVIGSDGSLTGYAGGLACKQWLLDHERDMHAQAA